MNDSQVTFSDIFRPDIDTITFHMGDGGGIIYAAGHTLITSHERDSPLTRAPVTRPLSTYYSTPWLVS